MAGRDPTRPQLEFPALVAELITQLRLTGQIGRLNFSDQVIPAFLIGSRGINFGGDLPSFASAAVFSGFAENAAANTVIMDTGPLPAGTYDLMAHMVMFGTIVGAAVTFFLQHRDAGNAATLANLISLPIGTTERTVDFTLPLMGYDLGLNERIRAISPSSAISGVVTSDLFAQIRPTP